MGDLRDHRLMYLKAALFLCSGTLAAAGIILDHPTLQTAFLLAIAIWSFARLYYFMFYVIEKYIDGNFRFAGIGSFLVYLMARRKNKGDGEDPYRSSLGRS